MHPQDMTEAELRAEVDRTQGIPEMKAWRDTLQDELAYRYLTGRIT